MHRPFYIGNRTFQRSPGPFNIIVMDIWGNFVNPSFRMIHQISKLKSIMIVKLIKMKEKKIKEVMKLDRKKRNLAKEKQQRYCLEKYSRRPKSVQNELIYRIYRLNIVLYRLYCSLNILWFICKKFIKCFQFTKNL